MKDEKKTKEQLISELIVLRRRIAEFEVKGTCSAQRFKKFKNSEEQLSTFSKNELSDEELIDRYREIERLNADLEKRIREVLEKNRQKDLIMIHQSRLAAMGEIIGLIAHQWRQPLNALNILLYNIKDHINDADESNVDANKLISRGVQTIINMSTTLDDFMDFFKPNKRKEKFSINKSIKNSFSILDASFRCNNISIKINEEKEITGHGSSNEYSQVILNILNNAKDVLREKGISGEIIIDIFHENDTAVVKIRDNGGGIPENILGMIFDPYFTTKSGGKSTGLGLYLSKLIIEDHMDGCIYVQNTHSGAEFSITTPINPLRIDLSDVAEMQTNEEWNISSPLARPS